MSVTVKSRIGRRLLVISITVTIFAASPLLLLIVTLLLLTRALLTLYIKLFSRDLVSLLTGMSSVIGSDGPYDSPTMGVIIHAIMPGQVPLKIVQEDIAKSFQEFDSHKPQKIYSKLRYELTSLLGFCAWKKDSKFSLENHIRLLNPKELDERLQSRTDGVRRTLDVPDVLTKENLTSLAYSLSMVPFEKGRSPWEILLYHNKNKINLTGQEMGQEDEEWRTILFFRIHHVLADAANIRTLLVKLTRSENSSQHLAKAMAMCKREVKKTAFLKKIGKTLWYPIGAVHDLYDLFVEGWDQNLWHRGIPKLRTDCNFTSFDIPMNQVKGIRKVRGGVKFFTVLLAAYTGGFRKYLMRKGMEDCVPSVMHSLTSIVRLRDPYKFKLVNDITGTIFTMPTGLNHRDAIIKSIEKEREYLSTSLAPEGIWIWGWLVGLLPKMFSVHLNFWFVTTCFAVNVPGLEEHLSIAGVPWLSMSGISLFPGAQGISFYATSYLETLTITLGVSRHVIPTPQDLLQFRLCVQEELEALQEPENNVIVDTDSGELDKVTIISME